MKTLIEFIAWFNDDTSFIRDALTASIMGVMVLLVAWVLMR